jgi:hypothetical protein
MRGSEEMDGVFLIDGDDPLAGKSLSAKELAKIAWESVHREAKYESDESLARDAAVAAVAVAAAVLPSSVVPSAVAAATAADVVVVVVVAMTYS